MRLCHLRIWSDFQGYGFNLHAEKNKTGQYIGKVDESSPAEAAGLQEKDRILEVNGLSVVNDNHQAAVLKIKSIPNETKLLVVDPEADEYFREKGISLNGQVPFILHLVTPERKSSGRLFAMSDCESIGQCFGSTLQWAALSFLHGCRNGLLWHIKRSCFDKWH